jgi:hypothetical protein
LSIFGSRKGIPVHSTNHLQGWAATLLGYEFRIEYRKSTDFGQADALSHLISAYSAPDEEVVVAALQAEFDMDVLTFPVTFDKLRSSTENDALLKTMKKLSPAGRTSKFSASTPTGRNSKASTGSESPTRSSKDCPVQGTWGHSNHAAGQRSQTSSPRTSRDPANEVTRAQLRVLAGHESRH